MPQCHNNDVTEKSILINATKQWFLNSAMNQDQFAQLLGEALEKQQLSSIPSDVDHYKKWLMNQKKKVSRIFKEDGYFPLDWRMTWLSVLPAEYKNKAIAETMALMGYIPVPLPTNITKDKNAVKIRANVNVVTHLFAQYLSRLNPALDGYYDSEDCRHELLELADSFMNIITQCKKELASIQILGIQPSLLKIFSDSPLFKE